LNGFRHMSEWKLSRQFISLGNIIIAYLHSIVATVYV